MMTKSHAWKTAVAAALAVSGAILLEGDVFSAQLFKFRPQMPGRPIVAPLDNGAVNFGPPLSGGGGGGNFGGGGFGGGGNFGGGGGKGFGFNGGYGI